VKLHALTWQTMLTGDHCYLDTTDECYFAGEYGTLDQPAVKSQIIALKQGSEQAIVRIAEQMAGALPPEWGAYTFVPMPPSSGAVSPLTLMVRQLPARDIRELLTQSQDTPASHCGWRPTPGQRATILALNEREADPEPEAVVIVDDVLATGSHFRSAKMVIRERWPRMRVIGVFLARVSRRRQRNQPAP
jgi:hypothetical protein